MHLKRGFMHAREVSEVVDGLAEYVNNTGRDLKFDAMSDLDDLAIVEEDINYCESIIQNLKENPEAKPLEMCGRIDNILADFDKPNNYTMLPKVIKSLKKYHGELLSLPCDSLKEITDRLGIDDLNELKSEIKLSDDISKHSAFIYKYIYSKLHVEDKKQNTMTDEDLVREFHGIQHVNRVAYYVPVLANLYKRHDNEEAKLASDDDIKLIQIAALFHDAGRENGDGVDYWDLQSSLLAYYYCKEILGVDEEKAIHVAETIANKDTINNRYYKLIKNENNQLTWKEITKEERNINQMLLHDADSLDIIRARQSHSAEYLDFYREIAQHNKTAMKEMAMFTCEVRSLIEHQGDGYMRQKKQVKKEYEREDGYKLTENLVANRSVENEEFPIFSKFYQNKVDDLHSLKIIHTTPYNPNESLSQENMEAALKDENTLVFTRSITDPSAINIKYKDTPKEYSETLASLELYKTLRQLDVPTRTGRTDRYGNTNRSVALIKQPSGTVTFGSAGFFIIDVDPEYKKVKSVNKENIGSGFGKRLNNVEFIEDVNSKKSALNDLLETLEKGPKETTIETNHNEIKYHITDYNAVFFTNDPVSGNSQLNDGYPSEPFHKHAAYLQAVFIQREYEKKTGKSLPIFEYSGIHGRIKSQPTITDQKVNQMWDEMITDYLDSHLFEKNVYVPDSLDELKAISMYGDSSTSFTDNDYVYASADSNYSDDSKNTINSNIQKIIVNKLNDFIKNDIDSIKNKSYNRKNKFLDNYQRYVSNFGIEQYIPDNQLAEIMMHIVNKPDDLRLIEQANVGDNEVFRQIGRQILEKEENTSNMVFTDYLKFAKMFGVSTEDQTIGLTRSLSNAISIETRDKNIIVANKILRPMIDLIESMPKDISRENQTAMFNNLLVMYSAINYGITASDIPNFVSVTRQMYEMANSLQIDTANLDEKLENSIKSFAKDMNPNNPRDPYHKHAAYLQTLFLQKEFEMQAEKNVPFFEDSILHSRIKAQPELTDSEISTMWVEMINDHIDLYSNDNDLTSLANYSFDQLKAISMHGEIISSDDRFFDFSPSDSNYSEELKIKINQDIQNLLMNKLNNFINDNTVNISNQTPRNKAIFLSDYLDYVKKFDIEQYLPANHVSELLKNIIKSGNDLDLIVQANKVDDEDLRQISRQILENNASNINFVKYLELAKIFDLSSENQIIGLTKSRKNNLPINTLLTTMIYLLENMPKDISTENHKEMFNHLLVLFSIHNEKDNAITTSDIPKLVSVTRQMYQMANLLQIDTANLDEKFEKMIESMETDKNIKHHIPELQFARSNESISLPAQTSSDIKVSQSTFALFSSKNEQKKSEAKEQTISTTLKNNS